LIFANLQMHAQELKKEVVKDTLNANNCQIVYLDKHPNPRQLHQAEAVEDKNKNSATMALFDFYNRSATIFS